MSDSTDLAAMAHICEVLRRENRVLRGLAVEAAIALEGFSGPQVRSAKAAEIRAELRDLDARRHDPMVRA